MLGPSSSALINLGARFPPCMKFVSQVPPSTLLGCKLASSSQNEVHYYIWIGMNNTANPVTSICTVEELCGFGGVLFLLTFFVAWWFDHCIKDFPTTPQTNGLGANYHSVLGDIISSTSRFITPIFLHAGIIHILLNMLAQVTLSAQVCASSLVAEWNSIRFATDWTRNGFRGVSNHLFCCRDIWVGNSWISLESSF